MKTSFKKEEALYVLQKNSNIPTEYNYSLVFSKVKEYIRTSNAYNDPYCRIIIEENEIFLFHSLHQL